ncbi:MAG: ACT domain-containing protein [Desulfobacterales bacterium]|jgi:glycine cleavage system transcriptional repressor
MEKVIVIVVGPDRPGIIAAVSGLLYRLEGNLENVSQTILQSVFTGTFIVSLPGKITLAELSQELHKIAAPLHLKAYVDEFTVPEGGAGEPASDPYVITTRGPDQKGLVARITAILAAYEVNVTDLQAAFKGGDDPDDNIMIYEVDLPRGVDRRIFTEALREKALQLDLQINIQHRRIFEAINRI